MDIHQARAGGSLTTWAAVVALGLRFVVESMHPAGAWIAAPDDTSIAIALAAVIVIAACVSGIAGLAFAALAGGALLCVQMDAALASRALAGVSIAAVCYVVWTNRASIRGCPPPWMLALGAATIPVGLWASIHLAASVYAAALGALLIGYVLYAFARATAGRRDVAASASRGIAGGLTDERSGSVPVSLLLAVSGFGLLARLL